jgi:PII-like signaling protein
MESSPNSIMKIYASTTDKIGMRLLYEYVVNLARIKGIAGVTVYRGIMGYGRSSTISSSKFWELTEKLPVVVEIIDSTEVLEDFYRILEPDLLKMPKGCLVTFDPVTIRISKAGTKGADGKDAS